VRPQCVPAGAMGRGVRGAVAAPTTAPATPSTAPASATQAGSAATAPSVSLAPAVAGN